VALMINGKKMKGEKENEFYIRLYNVGSMYKFRVLVSALSVNAYSRNN